MSGQENGLVPPPHYAVLGVTPSITQRELERCYRKLSLELHPDRVAYRDNPSQEPHVRQRYQAITEAYAVLSNPQKRSAYDVQHGVNFLSRVQGLERAIGTHNDEAQQRHANKRPRDQETADNAETGDVNADSTSPGHPAASPLAPSSDTSEDSDDDEEYAPGESHVSPAGNDASRTTGVMSLAVQRRRQAKAETAPQYRGVDLRRPCHTTTSSTSTSTSTSTSSSSSSPVWGLTIVGHELRHVELDSGVPFPAVISQVNGRGVRQRDTIAEMIRATAREETVTCDGTDVPHAVLSLMLIFTTETYDLVGDLSVLADDTTLDQLLPAAQVTTELRHLLPGRAVLAVNGSPVETAESLRAALKRASQQRSDTGRFARGISLDCASTHGV